MGTIVVTEVGVYQFDSWSVCPPLLFVSLGKTLQLLPASVGAKLYPNFSQTAPGQL